MAVAPPSVQNIAAQQPRVIPSVERADLPEEAVAVVEATTTTVVETHADIEVSESPLSDSAATLEPIVEIAEASVVEAASTAQVEELVEPEEVEVTAVLAEASSFEERLLESSPAAYAVQLLASHSEVNIQAFVAQLEGSHPAGYFETRYQDKPWFVAVLASFENRGQASEAISSLPGSLRSNEPWIRSQAGIQSDIRALLGSKLISSQ